MGFQGANLYTQGFGSRPESVEVPHYDVRAPTTVDISFPIGKIWINTNSNNVYCLTSQSSTSAGTASTWTFLGSGEGDLNTLTTDDSAIVTPSSGTINLAGASPLSTTGSGSTATINLSGTVGVGHGGTGATTLTGVLTGNGTSAVTANTVTNHGVLIGGSSNAVSSLSAAATGSTLMGVTGANPAFTGSPSFSGSVTAGTGLTVTTGNLGVSSGNANITGNVVASTAAIGSSVLSQVVNTDNTNAGSNAEMDLIAGGSSAGDPFISFQITGVGASTMSMGLDNSVSDTFVISNSTALGTSNALTLTQAGALHATTSIGAGTSITATLGNITATNGNLSLATAGNKLLIAATSSATCSAGTFTLGGSATTVVSNSAVTANSLIFLQTQALGTVLVASTLAVTAVSAGISFTVTPSASTDTSTVAYLIIN